MEFRATFNNIKWGSPSPSLSYDFKPKFKELIAGHIVTLVTYCVSNLAEICSTMIGQFSNTMSLESTDIWGGCNETYRAGSCFELPKSKCILVSKPDLYKAQKFKIRFPDILQHWQE